MRAKPFTKEQNTWLKEHHSPTKIYRILTEEYNSAFGDTRTVDVIKAHCRTALGLKQKTKLFTANMNAWLMEHSGKLTVKQMTEQFNAWFGENRNAGTIKVHCNRDLGIRFSGDGRGYTAPIGAESIRSGYIWVKVSNDIPGEGERAADINWKPKSHLVWEKHNGTIPEDYIIVFLNRDKTDCSIENLYAIPPIVNREMSKKKWWNRDPDLTLAAIKWCELFYAAKAVRKENLN